jgi:circadian clock protein KaiB
MSDVRFRLYIAGETPRSQRAIANLKRIAEEHLNGRYRLEIVDVMKQPQEAEENRILTTPTLVKVEPAPPRRVTGDLSDGARVLYGLALEGVAGTEGTPESPR